MKITYLDLFSGIGGFHKGILEAGIKIEKSYFSEVDKYAIQVYKRHFPEAEYLGAVESIRGDKFPQFDLITFGFPCQDLSVAGKRAGLGGKRSGLFSEAIRIINENKPCYFVFENVKGLFSSNEGNALEIILQAVADIGYDGQWQVLNTSWFLPQNRERIYFVGHPRETSRPEVFPITEGNAGVNPKSRG
jgi:DNA (cytosine-5)-methyltransferase 1